MTTYVGVIAEDKTDIAVFEILMRKITNKKIVIRGFAGRGGGEIIKKASSWIDVLKHQGCSVVILAHDLDEQRLTDLKGSLAKILQVCSIKRNIAVIPVKEVEAWFLADHKAIQESLKLRENVNKIASPETVNRPKEKLRDLIWIKSRKIISYTTGLNPRIAQACTIPKLMKCESFVPFYKFVKNI